MSRILMSLAFLVSSTCFAEFYGEVDVQLPDNTTLIIHEPWVGDNGIIAVSETYEGLTFRICKAAPVLGESTLVCENLGPSVTRAELTFMADTISAAPEYNGGAWFLGGLTSPLMAVGICALFKNCRGVLMRADLENQAAMIPNYGVGSAFLAVLGEGVGRAVNSRDFPVELKAQSVKNFMTSVKTAVGHRDDYLKVEDLSTAALYLRTILANKNAILGQE